MEITVETLARLLQGRLVGAAGNSIGGVAGLDTAGASHLTFLAEAKYRHRLRGCRAAAILVCQAIDDVTIPQIVVRDVNEALIRVLELFAPEAEARPMAGVDATARIAEGVHLGEGVYIGPYAVLEEGVHVGDHTVIGPGSHLGREVSVGDHSRLGNHVVVHSRCRLGSHVVVQSHTVIGSVGFGYVPRDGRPQLVPHIGNVVIDDYVEIGANCCIDRAKFDSTRIGAGTKIDNLVQVAHNVIIGRCCLIAGMVGISGSCHIGDGVVMGGQVGLRDHLEIGDGAKIGGKSFVMRDVRPGQQVFGYPAMEKSRALRALTVSRHLPEMAARLSQLERSAPAVQPARPSRAIRKWIWRCAALFVAAPGLLWLLSHNSRALFDADEVRVEALVRSYQDGDDSFFVTADSRLEDLRTSENLVVVGDLDQWITRLLGDGSRNRDFYFLVSPREMQLIKQSPLRDRLFLVTELLLAGHRYALVTTETDRPFMRL